MSKKPLAIALADLHLTNRNPPCRSDVYLDTLCKKLDFVSALALKLKVPVLDAGDLFDKNLMPPEVINKALIHLPKNMVTLPGNHDMRNEVMSLNGKTALETIKLAQCGQTVLGAYETTRIGDMLIIGLPYGCYDVDKIPEIPDDVETVIILIHIMTYTKKDESYVGCESDNAKQLLRKFDFADVIISGHNHKRFEQVGKSGNVLINPGSLMRMTADQVDYKPTVAILYDDLTVEYKEVPIDKDVVTRHHLDVKKEKDAKIDAFVSTLTGEGDVSLSFEKTVNSFMVENKVDKEVSDVVNNLLEEER